MKKAVGYIRVSSAKQVKGESLEVQQESIESYCKAFNIELVKVFKDAGISGRSIRKRIDLQNLLEYVSNNPSQWGYRNKAAVALYFRSYLSSCSVTRL